MEGFTKVAFAPMISEKGDNGYPEYGSYLKINKLESLNNVAIKVTAKKQTSTRKADNQVEELETETGYDVTLTVYDYDSDAEEKIFGDEHDGNGNTVLISNATPIRGCLFFEALDGNRVSKTQQFYLYDIAFSKPELSTKTFEGSDVPTIDITGNGKLVYVNGKYIKGACVKEGNVGFVTTDLPSAVYFPSKKVVSESSSEGNA